MTTSQRRRSRNPVAMSPLLRKGGVHQRSPSGMRAEAKRQLADDLELWLEETDEDEQLSNNTFPAQSGKDFAIGLIGII